MFRRLASAAALVATAALVLVGCTPPEPTETTPAPSPTQPSDPTDTPSPSRSDAELLDDAFAVATRFNRLVDEGFSDGVLPTEDLAAVASPDLIDVLQADLDQFTSRGLRLEGDSSLDTPSLVSREAASTQTGKVILATCMDTSNASTIDASGEVVSGGVERQPRLFELEYNAASMTVTATGPPQEPLDLPGCPR